LPRTEFPWLIAPKGVSSIISHLTETEDPPFPMIFFRSPGPPFSVVNSFGLALPSSRDLSSHGTEPFGCIGSYSFWGIFFFPIPTERARPLAIAKFFPPLSFRRFFSRGLFPLWNKASFFSFSLLIVFSETEYSLFLCSSLDRSSSFLARKWILF